MSIGGTIKMIEQDDGGDYSVYLGDTASMSSVRCSIDSVHKQEISTVKQWDNITVKGICAGFKADDLLGSDVLLVRCVLEKNKYLSL
ncbi:MAG: hypothetical protein HC867_09260 [Bacteroidia bacterium]|nr:hypothetical protein [Bacteroidia bacterium]